DRLHSERAENVAIDPLKSPIRQGGITAGKPQTNGNGGGELPQELRPPPPNPQPRKSRPASHAQPDLLEQVEHPIDDRADGHSLDDTIHRSSISNEKRHF